MKKFFLTIGFLSALSFRGLASTATPDELKRELSEQIIARVSSSQLVRALALRVPTEEALFARFQTVFHSNIDEFIATALEVIPFGKVAGINAANFIEKLWEIQEAKNAEASRLAEEAVTSGSKAIHVTGQLTEAQANLERLTKETAALNRVVDQRQADVTMFEQKILAARQESEDLKKPNAPLAEARKLVTNVSAWLSDHKDVDQSIKDPVRAAAAWVERREALAKTSQTPHNQEKLALAQQVLVLAQESPTEEAIAERFTLINNRIEVLDKEIQEANDALKKAREELQLAERSYAEKEKQRLDQERKLNKPKHLRTASELSTGGSAPSTPGSTGGSSRSFLGGLFGARSTPRTDGGGGGEGFAGAATPPSRK